MLGGHTVIEIKAYLRQYITAWPKCAFLGFKTKYEVFKPTILLIAVLTFKVFFAIIKSCKLEW